MYKPIYIRTWQKPPENTDIRILNRVKSEPHMLLANNF